MSTHSLNNRCSYERRVQFTGCIFHGNTDVNINQETIFVYRKKERIDGLRFSNIPEKLPREIIGRNQYLVYIDILLKREKSKRFAIIGPGGIGKTYVALQYALNWCKYNPHEKNVAFINCENESTIKSSITGLVNQLGIYTEQNNSELIKEVVTIYKGKELLFILDNFNTVESIQDFINAQNKNVLLIATSQNIELNNTFICCALEPLDRQSSIKLLRDIITSQEISETELVKIFEISSGFPLILTHMASCIDDNLKHNPNFQMKNYIQQYEKVFKEPFPDDFQTPNKKTAFATVKLNLERLHFEESKKLLTCLFYLNHSKIDLKILELIFDEKKLFLSLRELKKFSLIYFEYPKHDNGENSNKNHTINVHIQRIIEEISTKILEPTSEDLLKLLLVISSNSIFYLDHMEILYQKLSEEKMKKIISEANIDDLISICKHIFYKGSIRDETIKGLRLAGCIQNLDPSTWPNSVIISAVGFHDKIVQEHILERFTSIENFNLSASGPDGITSVHVAAYASSRFILRKLMELGAPNNTATTDGVKPIHIASAAGRQLHLETLLISGVDPNTEDNLKNTALHLAAKNLNWYLIELLTRPPNKQKNGVDINKQNKDGDTALHLAARASYEKSRTELTLYFLFKAGANKTIKNQNGETPVDVASQNKEDILEYYLINPHKLKNPNFFARLMSCIK